MLRNGACADQRLDSLREVPASVSRAVVIQHFGVLGAGRESLRYATVVISATSAGSPSQHSRLPLDHGPHHVQDTIDCLVKEFFCNVLIVDTGPAIKQDLRARMSSNMVARRRLSSDFNTADASRWGTEVGSDRRPYTAWRR